MTREEWRAIGAGLFIGLAIIVCVAGALREPVVFWTTVALGAVALILLRQWVRCRVRGRRRWRCWWPR